MSFPDLTLVPGHVLHSEATGVADIGDNTFDLGVALEKIYEEALVIDVYPLDGGVTSSSYVGLNGTMVTVNFVGTGETLVRAKIRHSSIR